MLLDNRSTVQIARSQAVSTPSLDADGFPVSLGTEWDDPRSCQWRTSIFNATAISGGEPYTEVRYRVTIEWDEEALSARRILLGGNELQVIEARPLRAVRKVLFIARPLCLSK